MTSSGTAKYHRLRLNTLGSVLAMGILLLTAFVIYDYNRVDASNTISVTAKVGATPPSRPAVISSPSSGQSVSGEQTLVNGSCQSGTYITLLSNDSIRGGTICNEEGLFSLSVNLPQGSNRLTAQTNDVIDQPGPTSRAVEVTSESIQPESGLKVNIAQSYQRISQAKPLEWQISLNGGASIFAVKVDWGDGQSELIATKERNLNLNHKYETPGARPIKITATDEQKNSDELSLVASVSSRASLLSPIAKIQNSLSKRTLYVTVILMMVSFLMGNLYKNGRQYNRSVLKT